MLFLSLNAIIFSEMLVFLFLQCFVRFIKMRFPRWSLRKSYSQYIILKSAEKGTWPIYFSRTKDKRGNRIIHKSYETLWEQKKTSISLKIMTLNDKMSFRVPFCREYTISQELAEYVASQKRYFLINSVAI